jgi:dynein heavy chain
MALKILEGEGKLVHEHLDFFLKGNLSLEKSERKRPYEWFPEVGWHDLMRLVVMDQQRGVQNSPLSTVADSIQRDEAAWRAYYELETPESMPLPDNLSKSLSTFEQLLVLRCVRMDRVTVCFSPYLFRACSHDRMPRLAVHTLHALASLGDAPTTTVVSKVSFFFFFRIV